MGPSCGGAAVELQKKVSRFLNPFFYSSKKTPDGVMILLRNRTHAVSGAPTRTVGGHGSALEFGQYSTPRRLRVRENREPIPAETRHRIVSRLVL